MKADTIRWVLEDELEDYGNSLDSTVPMPLYGVQYITLDKLEVKYPNIGNDRFKFDFDNNILECYSVRPYYGRIPANWKEHKQYDKIGDVYYKYLCDKNGEPYIDYYTFDSIVVIGTKDRKDG